MMLDALPDTREFSAWTWDRLAPLYDELIVRPVTAETVDAWLADWTAVSAALDEVNTRFSIATTVNTANAEAEREFKRFLDDVMPPAMAAEQKLKQKLLDSGLEPRGFEAPLRKLRAEAALYRDENVAPLSELRKLTVEYEKIAGARMVTWEGQEIPLVQLYPVLEEPDRDWRERAWRLMEARVRQDTGALADLWRRMMALRRQVALQAGFDNYRAYRWQQLFRFDYTPEDAKRFHAAIEEVVVPAASRLYAQRRERLGVPSLRPWDVYVDPSGRPPLRPYMGLDELEDKTSTIFRHVDPQLGAYFETMRAEKLLDLESRENKSPGGYSLALNVIRRPFIFTNAVGTHDDVQTLLHEGGHAFHGFEMAHLPYLQQRQEQMLPMEFLEVASMGMELLAAPYLTQEYGGFYTETEAARARLDNLRGIITFWPYMAMIDALQHWMYEHEEEAADLERCDDVWITLMDRFRPVFDWSELDAEKRTSWHQQSHVFTDPFYYIEYGMAQLGAVQVWANALRDRAGAVAAYRKALALGGTATLPELYAAAGARFAFDTATLRTAVELVEHEMARLEPVAAA